MNHNFFLSLVWLCGQGRTPPCVDMSFAAFLAKIDSQEHGPAVQGHPVESPPALLPQALTRTHGGPAKPYNTLHLLRRWCALAGGRRARRPRGCRQREPAPRHRTPFLPPRWGAGRPQEPHFFLRRTSFLATRGMRPTRAAAGAADRNTRWSPA